MASPDNTQNDDNSPFRSPWLPLSSSRRISSLSSHSLLSSVSRWIRVRKASFSSYLPLPVLLRSFSIIQFRCRRCPSFRECRARRLPQGDAIWVPNLEGRGIWRIRRWVSGRSEEGVLTSFRVIIRCTDWEATEYRKDHLGSQNCETRQSETDRKKLTESWDTALDSLMHHFRIDTRYLRCID